MTFIGAIEFDTNAAISALIIVLKSRHGVLFVFYAIHKLVTVAIGDCAFQAVIFLSRNICTFNFLQRINVRSFPPRYTVVLINLNKQQ